MGVLDTADPGLETADDSIDDVLNLFVAAVASETPQLELLRDLIQSNPEEFQNYSALLLRLAIIQSVCSKNVLEVLLDCGADPNQLHEGKHCLVQAAKSGLTEIVGLLLAKGADPEAANFVVSGGSISGLMTNLDPVTAESAATEEGYLEIVRMIHDFKHKKPSYDYQQLTWLINELDCAVEASSDDKIQNSIRRLIDEKNECLGCETADGRTIYEVLFMQNRQDCLKLLSESRFSIGLPAQKAVELLFSDELSVETFRMVLDVAPSAIGKPSPLQTRTGTSNLVHYLLQTGQVEKLFDALSKIEEIAKTDEKLPMDISEYSVKDSPTILHLACKEGNFTVLKRLLRSITLLTDLKKCRHSKKEVINFVDESETAKRESTQSCLQILIRSSRLELGEKIDMLKLLLENGADPNVKLGVTGSSGKPAQPTTTLLLEASETGDERLEITTRLMDFGAKDEGFLALYSSLTTFDDELTEIILSYSWPAVPDNYQCRSCTNRFGIQNSELVSELKRCLTPLGYSKNALVDNKILFSRKRTNFNFRQMRRSSSSFFDKQTEKVNFTLEPLQVSYVGLDIYKDIDRALVTKSVLHFFRYCSELLDYVKRTKLIPDYLLADLVTTLKIDSCATFDCVDPAFFAEFRSLKHLSVTNNKKLRRLPEGLNAEKSPIEELILSRNQLENIPTWIFSMKKLKSLNLSSNDLREVPVEMWIAYALEELDLSRNPKLQKLPEGNLLSLHNCDMLKRQRNSKLRRPNSSSQHSESCEDSSSTNDESIEVEVVPAERLQSAKPKFNRVSFFEKNYNQANEARPQQNYDEGDLVFGMRLQTLTVTDCSLDCLPTNLACLAPRLQFLNCKQNKIRKISIPEQFPVSLGRLELESNEIEQINFLFEKPMVCMRSNEYAIAEDEEATTTSVSNVYSVSSNRFIQRCRHTNHERLESLQSLDLGNNKNLTEVDFDYLETITNYVLEVTRVPSLSNLFLNDCNLKEISPSISRIRTLRWLSVSNNQNITKIPEDLAVLDKLQSFNFDGCPILDEGLRMKEDKGSAREVLRYLSAKREGKSAWRRMKLMFMGESNAGKTSLVRSLARSNLGSSSNRYMGVMRYAIRQHYEYEKLEQERNRLPLSTVGIDVNDWVYPKDRTDPKRAPIWFDTWDFAGQEVYQITHQYFISRRCLYLLVFNTVEPDNCGQYRVREKSTLINELKKWLNNIYCRIPNANFILVGTRKDKARNAIGWVPEYFTIMKQYLMQKFKRFDDDIRNKSSGFPKIHDVVFVSCLDGQEEHITSLCRFIWKVASEMKCDGPGVDKSRNVVDLEVPKKYKLVEGWVRRLRQEFISEQREPILNGVELRDRINRLLLDAKMHEMNNTEFDTMMQFMHENGIILHYDSALLNDKYFVDPQWMADQLAEVITVRESQDYGTSGIAKITDFVARISKIPALSNLTLWPSMFIPLLSQFEVALKFSENFLLIPSSLPTEREHVERFHNQWKREIPTSSVVSPEASGFEALASSGSRPKRLKRSRFDKAKFKVFSKYEILKGTPPFPSDLVDTDRAILKITLPEVSSLRCLSKVMIFSYIPFGFWARFIARVISDEQFSKTAGEIFVPDFCSKLENSFSPLVEYALNSGLTWRCWKTGLALFLWSYIPILEVKEALPEDQCGDTSPFSQMLETVKLRKHILINATGHMTRTLNIDDASRLPTEVEFREERLNKSFPKQVLSIKVFLPDITILEEQRMHNYTARKLLYMGPRMQTLAAFFEQISQHIDTLLTEWYPNLGETRFQMMGEKDDHTIERVIPCPECLTTFDKPLINLTHLNLLFSWESVHSYFEKQNRAAAMREMMSISSSESDLSESYSSIEQVSSASEDESNPSAHIFSGNERSSKDKGKSEVDGSGAEKNSAIGQKATLNRSMSTVASPKPVQQMLAKDEKQTVEKILRRYTTTIGGEFFDYSKDWQSFHGIEDSRKSSLAGDMKHSESFTSTVFSGYSSSSSHRPSWRASTRFSHTVSLRDRRTTMADAMFPKLHCFVEEEILLLACSGQANLACPIHSEFSIDEVAPNFLFIDLPPEKVLPNHMFEIDRYLGQGCFGAVFSGYISDPLNQSNSRIPVAYKFYQPIKIEDSFQAPIEDRGAIQNKQSQWLYEPAMCIADAYTELRKEVSVLMQLQNPYIVAFYGASLSPISLVLDVAPLGALSNQLSKFKDENALLPPPAIKDVVHQLASALAYIHDHAYVHRDLKPDNVLVWKFPKPRQNMRDLPRRSALVRLSDYGMTQKEISEGMLGRPGTMQYMAPEILADEGREIYTNKIDIYSLGMIIYDLVCLTPPWIDNFLEFRAFVLENKRPMTTAAARQSPTSFLDLLCFCSLPNPRDRPSASDVIEVLKEQEVCKLVESVQIKMCVDYVVANMGLSLLPGDGGPQVMNTIALYSKGAVKNWRRHAKYGRSYTNQRFDVTLLFYKDVLREMMNVEIDFENFCDERLTAVCNVYKTFWFGTDKGTLKVMQVTEGELQEKATNLLDHPIVDIFHLVHERGGGSSFFCVAVITSGAVINIYKHYSEVIKDTDKSDLTPYRLGTLEDSGFSRIYGVCLVSRKHEQPKYKTSVASKRLAFSNESQNWLHIPDNLELWVTGEQGQMRRFKMQKKTRRGDSDDGFALQLVPLYPVLKHDQDNLFEGRLKVKKLTSLDNLRRVWGAGAKNRHVYMWDADTFQLTTIACSVKQPNLHTRRFFPHSSLENSFESNGKDSLTDAAIIQVRDLKAMYGVIYVALNNGYVIALDAVTGRKLNQFQSNTSQTYQIMPLEPVIAPPRSHVMEHYQSLFLQKDPKFLTFGSGHSSIVESKFEELFYTPSRDEARSPTMMTIEDDVTPQQRKKVIVKLWNMYGDVSDTKSSGSKLKKQSTVTGEPYRERDRSTIFGYSGKEDSSQDVLKDNNTLSMMACLIPKEMQDVPCGLSKQELTQFYRLVRLNETALSSLANATPSDDDKGNDEAEKPRRTSSTKVKQSRSILKSFLKPSSGRVRIKKPMPKSEERDDEESLSKHCKELSVDVMQSGSACYKFTLTHAGQKIEFTNGVSVYFKPGSVKMSTERRVIIIVCNPKEHVVPDSQQEVLLLSPLVTIISEPRRDFLKRVVVSFPSHCTQNTALTNQIFTGCEIVSDCIFAVKNSKHFRVSNGVMEYYSSNFSAPVCLISNSKGRESPKAMRLNQLFPDDLYILIALYKETSQQRSLNFSCLDFCKFLGVIMLMPLNEIQLHGIKLPSKCMGARLEIIAFNQTAYLRVLENEIVEIAEPFTEPEFRPPDYHVVYRFIMKCAANKGYLKGNEQTFGKIAVFSSFKEITEQSILKSISRSILSTGENWIEFMKTSSFDDNSIDNLIRLDSQEVLTKVISFMEHDDIRKTLKHFPQFVNSHREIENSSKEEDFEVMIDKFICNHKLTRSQIIDALHQSSQFKNVNFSRQLTHFTAHTAAKCLIEKFRFNKVQGTLLDMAIYAEDLAASLWPKLTS